MKLQIGMDSMLKLLREFINQTGFAVWLIWCMEPGSGERKEGRNNICILVDMVHGTRVRREGITVDQAERDAGRICQSGRQGTGNVKQNLIINTHPYISSVPFLKPAILSTLAD
jgi:hypothetical protein